MWILCVGLRIGSWQACRSGDQFHTLDWGLRLDIWAETLLMSAKGTCTQTERLLRVAARIWGWGGVWPPVLRFSCFVSCLFCVCFVFVSCGVLHLVCGVVVGFVLDVLCVVCVGVGGVGGGVVVGSCGCACVFHVKRCVWWCVSGVCVVFVCCVVFVVWSVCGVLGV